MRMRLRLLVFGFALAFPASAALELTPEIESLLKGSGTRDDGTVYNMENRDTEVTDYVKSNWRKLVENIEQVPSHAGNKQGAIGIIELCAEELPPEEYMDFLDTYLDLYANDKDLISDRDLVLRICGLARKNDFLSVNWNHSRVKSFLKRADELANKNSDVHDLIHKIASGELSDMYLVNKPDDAPPPETLPGIKLRRPFESMIGDTTSPKTGRAERRPIKEVATITQAPQSSNFPLTIFVGILTALGCGIWFWIRRREAS